MSGLEDKYDSMENNTVVSILEPVHNIIKKMSNSKKQSDMAYWLKVSKMDANQIVLHAQEWLPEFSVIKRINMTNVMGKITIQLDDQEEIIYLPGDVIDVPGRTKMKIRNVSSTTAILVMKS